MKTEAIHTEYDQFDGELALSKWILECACDLSSIWDLYFGERECSHAIDGFIPEAGSGQRASLVLPADIRLRCRREGQLDTSRASSLQCQFVLVIMLAETWRNCQTTVIRI